MPELTASSNESDDLVKAAKRYDLCHYNEIYIVFECLDLVAMNVLRVGDTISSLCWCPIV